MCSLHSEYLALLNNNQMPKFLKKYLNVPSLVRLKNVGYFCGMDYASKNIYNFKEKISRYDHSLSVALLTWKLTHDKLTTLAGLFHDIATPCFSHVIDYMNKDYEIQESTEEYTCEIITSDSVLLEYLKEDNISSSDIINFKKYPIVDNKRPKLCADRLDGIILNGYAWAQNLNINDISQIINDITVYENEYHEKEIGFKTLRIAKKFLKINSEITKLYYTDEDNFMMELLSKITQTAINQNIIKYKDLLYLEEPSLLDLIKTKGDAKLQKMLYLFKNITVEEIPPLTIKGIKRRELNPLVCGIRINI